MCPVLGQNTTAALECTYKKRLALKPSAKNAGAAYLIVAYSLKPVQRRVLPSLSLVMIALQPPVQYASTTSGW